MRLIPLLFLIIFSLTNQVWAQVDDPFDPFSELFPFIEEGNPEADKHKSPDELIFEAYLLQRQDRLLDSRTKLLRALEKDPKAYKAHIALADYYHTHVNHYRLSLKYIKQAQKLFIEKSGKPPYFDLSTRQTHSNIISLISQIRLNLDNYQGALESLEEYESYGYYDGWLPASKAWILMKLGRLDEAISVAKAGLLLGANTGATQNILGILLSMTGKREASLRVFKDAIEHELSMGPLGNPSTPLNNSGEVYKEIFMEDQAKSSWQRALQMPDGCEHVLPSLNLALLLIEQTDYKGAKEAMDNFESCIAQFPLKNGEEHKALVHMARGRIAMHTGDIDSAIEHFRAALERQQWFGKIGTSQEDLQVGVMMSYAQALKRKNNHLRFRKEDSVTDRVKSYWERSKNRIKYWWFFRKTRQILAEDLDHMEDLYVRHTDSMIEYPTLGEVLAGFPTKVLERRIKAEKKIDDRKEAERFYKIYLGENLLGSLTPNKGAQLLKEVIESARPGVDDALKAHAITLLLRKAPLGSNEYLKLSYSLIKLNRSALRDNGFQLPVNYSIEEKGVVSALKNSPFFLDNSRKLPYKIAHRRKGTKEVLQFLSSGTAIGSITVSSKTIEEVINELADSIFKEEL